MAKYYAGQDGSVDFAGLAVAKVVQWSMTANTDALEVTTLSEDVRTFTTGVRTASGALTILYYDNAPVPLLNQVFRDGNAAQNPSIGDTALLKLNFGDKSFEFNAVLTSAELACVVGQIMRVNVNYTMSGDFVSKSL